MGLVRKRRQVAALQDADAKFVDASKRAPVPLQRESAATWRRFFTEDIAIRFQPTIHHFQTGERCSLD